MDSVTGNTAIPQKQSLKEPAKNIVTVLMKAAGKKSSSFFGLEKCCFTQYTYLDVFAMKRSSSAYQRSAICIVILQFS